jgi:hypothetical protein
MIYYLILFIMLIGVLILEKNDHNCSLYNPYFFGFNDSEYAKSQKSQEMESFETIFKKILNSQECIENFTIWRKLFLIALSSSIIAVVILQRPWDDDWFVFVLTFIIFSVSYIYTMFYTYHFVKERHDLLKNNLFTLKTKIIKTVENHKKE